MANQPASQMQLASQPAIWQNVNLILSLYLGGTSDQPNIWPNVNLTQSLIMKGYIWPNVILTQSLNKCQPDPKPHPGGTSDQMSA